MALCGGLACGSAAAQAPSAAAPPTSRMPAAPSPSMEAPSTPAPPPGAQQTYAANAIPGPTPADEIKPVAMALPDDPLEPYLLTKANGPFMVWAQVFRGPDAERMALALCKELRQDYKLPAYILRTKDFPMRSYIRGTPVQAPSGTMRSVIKQPEKIRTEDEAAVLVGDEKTEQATEKLLNEVRKIHPNCMQAMPQLFPWRQANLGRAFRTTNPYVPVHWLYPRTPDRLVIRMNAGPKSIAHCPGQFTIQVAQFSGHSAYDLYGQGMKAFDKILNTRESPLQTAHDDAEKLADQLSRSPDVQRLGQPVFVYHDRTSSRVFVGSFSSAEDPNVAAVHEELLKVAGKLNTTKSKDWRGRPTVDQMIVPASMLTKVNDLKQTIR
jgi:hypothetical protein